MHGQAAVQEIETPEVERCRLDPAQQHQFREVCGHTADLGEVFLCADAVQHALFPTLKVDEVAHERQAVPYLYQIRITGDHHVDIRLHGRMGDLGQTQPAGAETRGHVHDATEGDTPLQHLLILAGRRRTAAPHHQECSGSSAES